MWFGHIGPSFSANLLQEQQATLRKQYGFPAQQTSSAELEVPPSLRELENGKSAATSTASNATGGNQTAAGNQTATNVAGAGNQTSSAGNQTTGGNATAPTPAANTSGGASGGATAVSITSGSSSKTDNAFDPNPVKAKVGGSVTWTNDDSTPHTVTSGQNSKPDGKFDSSPGLKTLITPGQTFSHKFTEAGEYPYFCQLHPNMVGTVSVS
jgi:plastocyanin